MACSKAVLGSNDDSRWTQGTESSNPKLLYLNPEDRHTFMMTAKNYVHKKRPGQGRYRACLLLQSTSGFGVWPACASVTQCDTTRSQYASDRGTTCNSTPAWSHTCRHTWGCTSSETRSLQAKNVTSANAHAIGCYRRARLCANLVSDCSNFTNQT